MKKISASIVTIGDELLIGQVIDTNSAFIAQELIKAGIWVHRRVAVGDVFEEIWQALDEEKSHSEIILITGGLGPTADDITKPLLCQYFGGQMVVNQEALENVQRIFASRTILNANLQQAEVPDVCTAIQNSCGTAPGMWFEKDNHIFVSMPGVPHEMKAMITDYVVPHLRQNFQLPFIYHRTLLTAGIGESMLNQRIKEWENNLPGSIKLAYLPDLGKVRLRLTSIGDKEDSVTTLVNTAFEQLKLLVADVMVADRDISIEAAIGELLTAKRKTVATAESCTAGNIAHMISSVPGASAYLQGGIVSYSNVVKHEVLGVQEDTLQKYGAVSEQTVREMVSGVRHLLHTDYAVAVSGILGPSGGTPAKPAGTVWIAVADEQKIIAKKYHFRYDRERNMRLTTTTALNMLRLLLLEG